MPAPSSGRDVAISVVVEGGDDHMRTIVVGTDTSSAADLAVDDAARMARDRGAELVILHVRSEDGLRSVVDPARAADPRRHVSALGARYPDLAVRTLIEEGEPASMICDVAERERAEMIVVGNRGTRGSWWRVKDSVPNLVLRHSPCSVFIVDTRRAQ
jgi:nucleotide-binding universal stress UspA family protein